MENEREDTRGFLDRVADDWQIQVGDEGDSNRILLMDTPDLEGTMAAFHRVLKTGGIAVLVFSHPCFPAGNATQSKSRNETSYLWTFPYFERRKCTDPPWAHFKSDFIWFHRPLSDYWKAFRKAGFDVIDFEEPRITEDRYHLAADRTKIENSRKRPYSVAFKLKKPAAGLSD